MKKVLENLLNTEKQAKDSIEKANRDADTLISNKKAEASSLLDEKKMKLQEEEKKQLDTVKKKVNSEVKKIQEQGKIKLNTVQSLSPSKRKEALQISSEILFGD